MNASHMKVICAGSVLWDFIGRIEDVLGLGGDKGGRIVRRPGGVAYNIAQKLAMLGTRPLILSVLGNDTEGKELCETCNANGLDMRFVYFSEALPTDQYMAIEDKNGLVAAIADAHSLEREGDAILATLLDPKNELLNAPQDTLLILDGNFTEAQLSNMAQHEALKDITFIIAPASPGKVDRLRCFFNRSNTVLFCNLSEASILSDASMTDAKEAAQTLIDRGFDRVIVTNGSEMACDAARNFDILCQTPTPVKIQGVTGAGDVFMACHVFQEINGATRENALSAAILAAGNYVSGQEE